jgi:chromosomal replication initiation ATPase DnaA
MSWSEKRKPEIDKLIDLLQTQYLIKKSDLLSKSRKKEFVKGRRIFMNILFEVFEKIDIKLIQSDISEIINRDRTSFIHHRKEHLSEYKQYKKYREEYETLKKEYENSIN